MAQSYFVAAVEAVFLMHHVRTYPYGAYYLQVSCVVAVTASRQ